MPVCDDSVRMILVGYRAGDVGGAALAYARRLATTIGADLHVVHVVDLDDHPSDPDGLDWEADAQRRALVVRDEVEAQLAGSGLGWTYETSRGEAAAVLARAADEVDAEMLVVGVAVDTTGRLLHRAIGRSTGRDLLRHARRPVLFVPGEPSR